jgi:hypothetical protein
MMRNYPEGEKNPSKIKEFRQEFGAAKTGFERGGGQPDASGVAPG